MEAQDDVREGGSSQVVVRPSAVPQGATAGFLGATAVALWFLIIDFARGHPFQVPSALGHLLLHATGLAGAEGMAVHVVAYTIFHYVAFIGVGIIASMVLRSAEREPSLLAGAFIFFAVFEVAFYAMSAIIAESPTLGAPAWYLVAGGNLLASLVMGIYLWRANPSVGAQLDHVLSGRDGASHDQRRAEPMPAGREGSTSLVGHTDRKL